MRIDPSINDHRHAVLRDTAGKGQGLDNPTLKNWSANPSTPPAQIPA
ncbi:hypothetical protein [Nocardia xishanensis]|nr:hypothetical protein [Nocardia xishanensis]